VHFLRPIVRLMASDPETGYRQVANFMDHMAGAVQESCVQQLLGHSIRAVNAQSWLFMVPHAAAEMMMRLFDDSLVGPENAGGSQERADWDNFEATGLVVQIFRQIEEVGVRNADPTGDLGLKPHTYYASQERTVMMHEKAVDSLRARLEPEKLELAEYIEGFLFNRRSNPAPEGTSRYEWLSVAHNAQHDFQGRESALRSRYERLGKTPKGKAPVQQANALPYGGGGGGGGGGQGFAPQQPSGYQYAPPHPSWTDAAAHGAPAQWTPEHNAHHVAAMQNRFGSTDGGPARPVHTDPPPAGKDFTLNVEQKGKVVLHWDATSVMENFQHKPSTEDFEDAQIEWKAVVAAAKDAATGGYAAALRPDKPYGGAGEPAKPTFRQRIVRTVIVPTAPGGKVWPDDACAYCANSPPAPPNCPPAAAWAYRNPLGGGHNPSRCAGAKAACCMMPKAFATSVLKVSEEKRQSRRNGEQRRAAAAAEAGK
jgi:hypothetical protein